MRLLRLALLLCPLALGGCLDSHGRDDDAGGPRDAGLWLDDGGGCVGTPALYCGTTCGGDAGHPAVCSGGSWVCPPGTIDLSTCPPGCFGPPRAGCVCRGTEWVCEDGRCPEGLNPWDPDDPLAVCGIEGATCTNGGTDACGVGQFCTCRSGRWECLVAEPDPVCWCGRQPAAGDRCSEEGASCGECCPTAGGTGWPAMGCVEGRWQPADCPAIECPPVAAECPVDTLANVGASCAVAGARCGHACCDTEIVCDAGAWRFVPSTIDCARCPEHPCGDGACTEAQYCHRRCGPTDGLEHVCQPLPEGCSSCDCIPLWGTQTCEMVGGFPHVRELGFCG